MKRAPAVIAAMRLRESSRVMVATARTHGRQFARAAAILTIALKRGRKVLACGNGGSASDASHLVAELVGRFIRERRALPAIALGADTAVLTALGNDYGYARSFARQVEALAVPGDVLVAISTSGRSPNILAAIAAARARGASVIGLTSKKGRAMARRCDAAFVIPSRSTPRVQEAHIAVYHILCELIDEAL